MQLLAPRARVSIGRVLAVAAVAAFGALSAALPLACGDDAGDDAPRGDAAIAEGGGSDAPLAPDASVVPRGARVLGLAVDYTDLNFPVNLDVARDAGAQTTEITFAWDDIERPYDAGAPDPDAGDGGEADAAPPVTTRLFDPALHVVNLVLSDRRVEATLALEAFDVGGSRAPIDLAARPLNDAATLARYDALVDYAFDQLHDTKLTALVVASAADAWVAADAQRAPALAAFVSHVAARARSARPGLRVGFTVDSLDATVRQSSALASAWAASDFAGVDYVPPVEVSSTHPAIAALVSGDFARLASAIPAPRPILLRRAGYPSSPGAGSDDATQAAFIVETFRAWDLAWAAQPRIFGVIIRELDDATPTQAAALGARRKRSDSAFLALVGSLGMRATSGAEKPAFGVLRREARQRGW